MNKLTSLLIGGASAVALGVSSLSAQEPLGVDVSFGYSSAYYFRGFDFGDDLLDIDLSYGGSITEEVSYGVGVWYASFDGGDEVNYYASLGWDLLGLSWELGGVLYEYPDTGADIDTEFYFAGSTTVEGIDLSVKLFDYKLGESTSLTALEFGAGTAFEVIEQEVAVGLTYGASLDDAVEDYFKASVSTDFPLGTATLSPYISYVDSDNGVDGKLVGGAYIGLTF